VLLPETALEKERELGATATAGAAVFAPVAVDGQAADRDAQERALVSDDVPERVGDDDVVLLDRQADRDVLDARIDGARGRVDLAQDGELLLAVAQDQGRV